MRSDRSSDEWAVRFHLAHFGLPPASLAVVAGAPGRKRLNAMWKDLGPAIYDRWEFSLRQEWFHSWLPSRIVPRWFEQAHRDWTMLDYGCGTAEAHRRRWEDLGGRAILMDVPGPNFEYTKAKFAGMPNVTFRPVGAPLPSGYQMLWCMDVLEHVPNPLEVLRALWDGLAPGGTAHLWMDGSCPATAHLAESVAQIPDYFAFLRAHGRMLHNGTVQLVEKPRRRWWWA